MELTPEERAALSDTERAIYARALAGKHNDPMVLAATIEDLVRARIELSHVKLMVSAMKHGIDRFGLLLANHPDFEWSESERHLYAEIAGDEDE